MVRVDIISGFLGAGKTTLIKKLLAEAFPGERLALIENEFGEISVDGGFLKESGVQISEMSSGCICCSLVGDFGAALKELVAQYAPDRILIEPSGVGKLSEVVTAVQKAAAEEHSLRLGSFVAVVDASKAKVYLKNFGEFYSDQVECAQTIILSRTQKLSEDKLAAVVAQLRERNPKAVILTTPWDQLDGKTILSAIEKVSLEEELLAHIREEHEHHHHHGHGPGCDCGCHDHEHEHHHHDHEEEHEHHEDHHEHGEECSCGCHDHHHHHHADEVFASWGRETPKNFSREQVENIMEGLDSGECGTILRAKGILPAGDGSWLHFDYVPEEHEVRTGPADYTGRLCVIGAGLNEDRLAALFGL